MKKNSYSFFDSFVERANNLGMSSSSSQISALTRSELVPSWNSRRMISSLKAFNSKRAVVLHHIVENGRKRQSFISVPWLLTKLASTFRQRVTNSMTMRSARDEGTLLYPARKVRTEDSVTASDEKEHCCKGSFSGSTKIHGPEGMASYEVFCHRRWDVRAGAPRRPMQSYTKEECHNTPDCTKA